MADGSFRIALRSSPVDGRANMELREFLASEFGTSKSSVSILTGSSSRRKLISVSGQTVIPHWFSGGSVDD